MGKFYISNVVENYINNTLAEAAAAQERLDSTIAQLTARSPDVTDQYKAAPQPGHGPGTYQPRARATNKDTVALFVPDTSFKAGDWQDFQRARDQVISWLRSHRYQVEDAQKLCWGPAFGLDPEPISYRDTDGVSWYNAAIEDEPTYQLARIHARA
ncbi:hypothetical protein [Intestinimonas butyriciproducens]|uniref:hypothetical protein n=1 Tax=Intestinimonas butyriciproducens TaxID=1297617 RepID=UPI001957F869|nr:hypothetical protein [Intestinimonas butyriciproducens]MBM6976427.1 hypothetical protein [Intestinimonas butyriciproducens]